MAICNRLAFCLRDSVALATLADRDLRAPIRLGRNDTDGQFAPFNTPLSSDALPAADLGDRAVEQMLR